MNLGELAVSRFGYDRPCWRKVILYDKQGSLLSLERSLMSKKAMALDRPGSDIIILLCTAKIFP